LLVLLHEQTNNSDFISYLISKGCDTETPRKDGFAALHGAVDKEATGSIRALLLSGAKVDVRNRDDETPLHMVCGSWQWRTFRLKAFNH
jgi:ankyrin repeat protein